MGGVYLSPGGSMDNKIANIIDILAGNKLRAMESARQFNTLTGELSADPDLLSALNVIFTASAHLSRLGELILVTGYEKPEAASGIRMAIEVIAETLLALDLALTGIDMTAEERRALALERYVAPPSIWTDEAIEDFIALAENVLERIRGEELWPDNLNVNESGD